MTIGIVGRKKGMTRVFTEEGQSVPVTVIEAQNNRVIGMHDLEKQGYKALQVAWGNRKPNLINKATAGIYAKAKTEAAEGLVEFRLQEGEGEEYGPGSEIKVDLFSVGQKVDISGTSIGKGFAGTIKRHHFGMGGATHGNSLSHRSAGSIGQCQTPGRVFKGKKMAGHLGNKNRTVQNLEIVKIDSERNLLLVKGAVPGSKGGKVVVRPSVKTRQKN